MLDKPIVNLTEGDLERVRILLPTTGESGLF